VNCRPGETFLGGSYNGVPVSQQAHGATISTTTSTTMSQLSAPLRHTSSATSSASRMKNRQTPSSPVWTLRRRVPPLAARRHWSPAAAAAWVPTTTTAATFQVTWTTVGRLPVVGVRCISGTRYPRHRPLTPPSEVCSRVVTIMFSSHQFKLCYIIGGLLDFNFF